MLNLVLYSDQIIPENAAIDAQLLNMLKSKGGGTRIGYVASGPEPDLGFFRGRQAYYAQYGLQLAVFHDLDEPYSKAKVSELLACDAIHLSGGQTSAFLERLKRSAMLGSLRDWAFAGGILIGTSAGAILMTPTIATDALFSGRPPEEVEDGLALGLVPFEFFPHLASKSSHLANLLNYSRSTPRPIVACRDGEGIVVREETVECLGGPVWLAGGAIKRADEISLAGFSIRSSLSKEDRR